MSSVEVPQYNKNFSMILLSFIIVSMVILRVPDCLHNKAISQATAGTMSIFSQKTTRGGEGG